MIQPRNIHPLTDFQRNTELHLRNLRESGLPEVLTVEGRAELVVQAVDSYQELLTRLELSESAIAINRGFRDLEEGKARTLGEFDELMRSKMGAALHQIR